MERRAGRGRPKVFLFPPLFLVISLVRLYSSSSGRGDVSFVFFLKGGWGPDYDRLGRYWCQGEGHIYKKQLLTLPEGSGGAAAMALRAACSGIKIQDYTHTQVFPIASLVLGLLSQL